MNFDPLRVKFLSANAKLPKLGSSESAGYDLYSSEASIIPARGKVVVPTGIAISMPVLKPFTTVGLIHSRSGLSAKHGVEKGAGVIDQDYRGEIKVVLYNHSDKEIHLEKHSRIAQLLISFVLTPVIMSVDTLEETDRGVGGFGSTGVTDKKENLKD